jgi:nickel superoxide dismutase
MKTISVLLALTFLVAAPQAFAHCQVPCGIYDDEMRLEMISEHIKTIEKAMTEINELSSESPPNYNQIVRWVSAKEDHADDLTSIVTWYFMNQRLEPVAEEQPNYKDYITKLTLLHEMMVYSMKAKQTTDLENVEKLRKLLKSFTKVYLGHEIEMHFH